MFAIHYNLLDVGGFVDAVHTLDGSLNLGAEREVIDGCSQYQHLGLVLQRMLFTQKMLFWGRLSKVIEEKCVPLWQIIANDRNNGVFNGF